MSNLDIYVHPGGHPPTRAHDSDAGLDLYPRHILKSEDDVDNDGREYYPITIKRYSTRYVPLGVSVAVPHGHVGLLLERSSLHQLGLGLDNKVGVIDSGYRGELKAALTITGKRDTVTLPHGKALVQLVIVPIALPTITMVGGPEYLGLTERQAGGFGSTDYKEK